MDRDLLELAIRACGGEPQLAAALRHDIPAIDWWRRAGVPEELRAELCGLIVEGLVRSA